MSVKSLTDPKVKVTNHNNWVRCVRWNPEGEQFATCSADKTVKLFGASGNEIFSVQHPDWVWCLAFSPKTSKRRRLATACLDGLVRILDASNGRSLLDIKQHTGTVNCVDFSSDGEMLISGSYDKTARIFSVITGKQISLIEGHNSFVLAATFSKDATKAVTASVSGEVRVTDIASGTLVALVQAHEGPVNSLAFSSDGCMMVSGGGDKVVNIWDTSTDTWTKRYSLKHPNCVQSVSFSPDDLLLATAGTDSVVRIFEVSTKKDWVEVARVNGHIDEVNSVSFYTARNHLLLATGSDDKTACVWDLTPVSVALKVSQAKERKEKSRSDGQDEQAGRKVGDTMDMDGVD